ncbi:uncharacterized protein LOC127898904 [Citrus sinensis]|uniref:uncharacterized protein LOC127898904 n=1 Tax=Citrus sinensis TaxID=2711 RepID=UPI002277AF62|nr:uncharacterized protein LOC127898904 [Citrus sinensis]
MCQKFAEQFSGAMAPEDDMMELKSMKQGEQETLREFIKRFHRAVLDLGAFNHPQAKRDIEIEEEKAARIRRVGEEREESITREWTDQEEGPPDLGYDSAYGGLHQHSHGSRGSRPEVLPPPPTQNGANRERAVHLIDQNQDYGRYTSLKMSLDEVYEVIKDRGLLYPPSPITKLPNMRDMGRYCKFHGTHGHTTADCKDLKTQVEDLVRNRYLDEFIDETFPMVASTSEGEQSDRSLKRE